MVMGDARTRGGLIEALRRGNAVEKQVLAWTRSLEDDATESDRIWTGDRGRFGHHSNYNSRREAAQVYACATLYGVSGYSHCRVFYPASGAPSAIAHRRYRSTVGERSALRVRAV
jgi:hypothetical protein